MSRKLRSDTRVDTLERRLGLEPGAIRNPDGSDARGDKRLGTLRKEFEQRGKTIKTNPSISAQSIEKALKAVSTLNKKSAPKNKRK